MKKTILSAAIIAATSFSTMAEMDFTPVEPGRPGTNPIETPIVIDPQPSEDFIIDPIDCNEGRCDAEGTPEGFSPDQARENIKHDINNALDNMTAREKVGLLEMGLEKKGSEYKVAAYLPNPETGETFVVLEDADGNMHKVTEQDVKDHVMANAADRKAERDLKRAPKVIEDMPIIEPPVVDPIVRNPVEKIEEAKERLQNREDMPIVSPEPTGELAAQAYSAYDARIENAETNIDLNAQAIANLEREVDRLDEKLDGVMAGTHAVNNARPFLSGTGQTAMGVGVGYAGDAGAIAVGAAHSFTENWSASATLNVTTGSYSEVSGGAGVQYVF